MEAPPFLRGEKPTAVGTDHTDATGKSHPDPQRDRPHGWSGHTGPGWTRHTAHARRRTGAIEAPDGKHFVKKSENLN